MKLKKLYDLIIAEGLNADPRPKATIQETLEKRKQAYAALNIKQKDYFNKETLDHPFDDTRVLFGAPDTEIKTAMVGVDIDAGELLTIDRLNAKNKNKIDLAISHHPQGLAFAALHDVMHMQADIFHAFGVPINIAEDLVEDRQREVGRRIHAANHYRAADIARLLGVPFLCMHTPADNHAAQFLQKLFDTKKPKSLKDIVDLMLTLHEYQTASSEQVPPMILFGKPGNRPGKIFVDMTGGTEGPKDIVDHLINAGVGTIVGMHLSEDAYKKFQGKHLNVIIAGHIASDNLGINLLCDKIEKAGAIKFVPCSGFRRVRR